MSYSNPKAIALLLTLSIALGVWLYLGNRSPNTPPTGLSKIQNLPTGQTALPPVKNTSRNSIEQLVQASTGLLSLNDLNGLSLQLGQLSSENASAAIATFLDTQADRSTGLTFSVGEGGSIPTPPSLRVFLLDKLGQISPVQAAAYSTTIFESKSSPDEWALALRNLGKFRPELPSTRSEVAHYADELLNHPPWQQDPTPAYLESFDAIVFGATSDSVQSLCEIVNTSSDKSLRFAAYLTLERLVETAPNATLSTIAENPGLLANRPGTRAGLFSKLQQATPENSTLIAHYLSNERFTETERLDFLQRFPSSNQFHSYTLLSNLPNIGNTNPDALESLAELLASIDTATLSADLKNALAHSAERLALRSTQTPQ